MPAEGDLAPDGDGTVAVATGVPGPVGAGVGWEDEGVAAPDGLAPGFATARSRSGDPGPAPRARPTAAPATSAVTAATASTGVHRTRGSRSRVRRGTRGDCSRLRGT